jgi:hypothetical protein
MICFPQLSTGALAQYPLIKRAKRRTVENRFTDGCIVALADDLASEFEWELRYQGLDSGERTSLESFHAECEGRLRPFTFLDPTSNLLRWSEDLGASDWSRDAGLTLLPGVPGPGGIPHATRVTNVLGAAQSVSQTIAAPGNYHYCFSVYVSAANGETVRMIHSSGTESASVSVDVTAEWRRVAFDGRLASSVNAVTFGIEVNPGAAVNLFGFQVEPQPRPGIYRSSLGRSGVYSTARLSDDVLRVTAEADGQFGCTLRVITWGVEAL